MPRKSHKVNLSPRFIEAGAFGPPLSEPKAKAPEIVYPVSATFDVDPLFTAEPEPPPLAIPEHWNPGALLNVRNTGPEYIVTLFPEEYDWRHPEKALKFTNPARCQDFVSNWYARQSFDGRAW